MSGNIIIVYKKVGETPLDCVNNLKKLRPELAFLPVTYAGRLDPLAEGLLILLAGEECLKKDEYLSLKKEYQVEVLFGFATDTYDLMGEITSSSKASSFDCDDNFISILEKFTGRIKQEYPPYSSRTVEGKPLFTWAREGKLSEITIPSHDVSVDKIEIVKEGDISSRELLDKIKNDISLVRGDFRQKQILEKWYEALKDNTEENYKVVTLEITCGSGVYVRSIANSLGLELQIPSLALSIKRTKIGEYGVGDVAV